MEVGTKELKKGNKKEAWELFEKSYKLYSLFWAINLGVAKIPNSNFQSLNKIQVVNDKNQKKMTASVFDKIGNLVQKAVDCCKE